MPWMRAAVLLAGDDQRVEDPAAVVDGDVAQRRDLAGLDVDLDDRDVGAERERRAVLGEVGVDAEAAVVLVGVRPRARASDTPAPGTPATPKPVVVELDVRRRWPRASGRPRASACSRSLVGGLGRRRCRRAAATASRRCRRRCGRPRCRTGGSVIFSSGMPSRSATIIENDVAWPWPWAEVPDITVAEPSSWICDRAELRAAEAGDLDVRRDADAEQLASRRPRCGAAARRGRASTSAIRSASCERQRRSRRCRRSAPVWVL